ncbi:ArsR/SmtB family transcription factor [Streptomyces sp. NRRL F-5053]|uniref:ArsR/SmtB family transcription factor n=1 Tax=Streptomyces sp. NRRL F-5053 TaxID=1463854 RepID=UPI0013316F09|nr:helix-turn-helix domain-containing protein [Streptomyces sp. NRRL F-5053]
MLRIHFTAADIAKTRLKGNSGPLIETAFAYGLLGRNAPPPYAGWRRQVAKRLPSWPRLPSGKTGSGSNPDALLQLINRRDAGDSQGGSADLSTVAQVSASQEATGLSEVWQAAIAPYWDRLVAYLETECEARGRVVMGGGVELLLATLHPKVKWAAQTLEIAGGADEDVVLDHRGLVLVPSVFLHHRPAVLTGQHGENGEPVLAFATPPDGPRAASLWDDPADTPRSLGPLVGQTRAAALRVLRATCTTSQLAEKLSISAANASQHTTVLRQSGLISTRRIRNTVLHTVTPLGLALLDGPAVAAPESRRVSTVAAEEVRRMVGTGSRVGCPS